MARRRWRRRRGTADPGDVQERLREFQRRNLQSEVGRLLIALLLTSDTPSDGSAPHSRPKVMPMYWK